MPIINGKKGAVEMQFNWIFVLIAGAVILIVFATIAMRQKGVSDTFSDISSANGLEAILFGKETAAESISQVEMPNSKIDFNCNSYSINGVSKSIGHMNLFMPSSLQGNKMIIMSREWNVPYKVSNFLYMTSPKMRYILIGNSLFARNIFESIPELITMEGYTTVDAIQEQHDDNLRIIFFEQSPTAPIILNDAGKIHATALAVRGNNSYGTVEFFDFANGKFESKGISFYVGEPSLFGAIFSDNLKNYNCSMEKAFDKLKILFNIYKEKIGKTSEIYSAGNNKLCLQLYNETLIPESSKLLSKFSSAGLYSGEEIANATQDLEIYNDMAKSLSCIPIY